MAGTADESDAGVNLMRRSRERAQHALCVSDVVRLVEDLAVEHYSCVRAEHPGIRMQYRDCLRLLQSETLYIRNWIFAGTAALVDVRRHNIKAQACLREQLAPARRCRRKDEPSGLRQTASSCTVM
jgi:hypothetical protein